MSVAVSLPLALPVSATGDAGADLHDDHCVGKETIAAAATTITNRSKLMKWCNKILDTKEAKAQSLFALPMILTNVFYYLITLVSVMFAGHLGGLQLAGATLANSWATVSGFAFMTGLSGALETLAGQSFGANMHRMLGVHLQASCIISFLFSIIISIIWLFTEPLLILLHQEPQIAATAALYMKYLIPGLFAYGFLQNILRFLQTQSVVFPLALFSFIPMCIHIGIAYSLVHSTHLGFKGAALAASITLWLSVFVLAIYVRVAKSVKRTWNGFLLESVYHILINLKLALPSAGMVCLEYGVFEILVILAGLMPNPSVTTSLIAICVNTETVAYMLTYGLSAAASTRVSNELGAGNPERAKRAMAVTLKLSVVLALVVVSVLQGANNIWAGFFTQNHVIVEKFSAMAPFLAISITFDAIQGVLSGVARGCGWQHLAVCANLATFYLIGIPIACVLGFKLNLHVKGLWIGLICGISCQSATLLLITMKAKWARTNLSVNEDRDAMNKIERKGDKMTDTRTQSPPSIETISS